jgi:hypothetical protein
MNTRHLMRLRPRLHLAALTLLAAGAAACTDESPLLTGDPFFPDGRPVTVEVIVPASEFLQVRGAFTGYADASAAPFAVIANQFEGGVTARTLVRFPGAFPETLEYTQDAVARRDSAYTVVSAEVVLLVDSSATVGVDVPITAHRLTEAWDDSLVSWTVRSSDSTGVHPWTQPGGTFGPQVGQGMYVPADSASIARLALTQAEAGLIRTDSAYAGLLLQSAPGSRLEMSGAQLRLVLRPSNGLRDTTIAVTVDAAAENVAFIYTPEPPQPASLLQAGTVLGARTLFSMHIPDSVSVCDPTCRRLATRDIALHHVSLLLRPRAAPGGYRLLDSAAVSLRTVKEPELGRLAPLGGEVAATFDAVGRTLPARQTYAATDTLVEIAITVQAAAMIASDSVPGDFALLGSTFNSLEVQPFSLLLFDADPRLRLVFTLPERPRLP